MSASSADAPSLERSREGAGGFGARARSLLTGQSGPFLGVGTVLLVLIALEMATEPVFSSSENLTNLMRAAAIPLVLATTMTLVLLTGGIDLSVGAILGLSGVVFAKLTEAGLPVGAGLVLTLAAGTALGAFNGVLIGGLGMSFFVVTLAGMAAYRGLGLLWTNNDSIDMFDNGVSNALGNKTILGEHLPIAMVVAVLSALVMAVVLARTVYGRSVYAVGGNREAAELSGLRAARVIVSVYALSGLSAALAGVMTIGTTTVAQASAGTGIELDVIAAVLLGGVALSGGVGTVAGAALGVVFLQVLRNALNLGGLSEYWQSIVTGVILVIAVALDQARRRMAEHG